ncbi:FAD-binding domain-containing protein [Lutimonas sp.]|uniref:FAD-binding domain-containing protein n=1 Tax=Lutimonas sp. TaxID=1872403 RepID=UPI003D9B9E94
MKTIEKDIEMFPTSMKEINDRIDRIDPVKYAKSRNYLNGAISYLSPYISRGVISTKFVLSRLVDKGYHADRMEKFIQELAWRDYWQQVWISKKDAINTDFKRNQHPVSNMSISSSILEATTGIEAIDKAILDFYKTGYLHNHMRMYIAALASNIARSHWRVPAQWMYYHLLDADWASNALSWQWVAGTYGQKKYYANQDNINKYCFTDQKNTFLDISYGSFATMNVPIQLVELAQLVLHTPLPLKKDIIVNPELPTCLYNFYNMDPSWKEYEDVNRVLILEPSHFEKYPVSKKSIDFLMNLSRNIKNIQVFVGEFDELILTHKLKTIYFKEHPLVEHYQGEKEQRDWMFSVRGEFPSFFAYWKQCKKELLPIEYVL